MHPVAPATPRAIFFDLDDTLFDHSMTCRAAIGMVRRSERFLARRSTDELWRQYTELLDGDFGEILAGRISAAEARTRRWERIARRCGARLSRSAAAELSRAYREQYQALRRPVPGAVAVLRRLHPTVTIGVITNNEVAEQEEKVRFLGAEQWVDLLVVSEEVGVPKPDPRIFRAALDRARVDASQAVMVGDSWRSDVVGALGVGVRPIWFNRFGLTRPDPWAVDELRSFTPAVAAGALIAPPAPPESRRAPPRSGRIKSRGPLPRP